MQDYPAAHMPRDILAGMLVAVLVIPQNLAFAILAGLPPQAGLYASILPVIAYALWGSSMTQAVGPVAVIAIMTSSVLTPLAAAGSPQYLALASSLALTTGLLVFACGALKLGFLSQLLSRPVASGFISGSAMYIVFNQCKPLVGWSTLSTIDSVSAAVGGTCLVALLAARRWMAPALVARGVAPPRADLALRVMPLALVALATLFTMYWDLDGRHGVAVVGTLNAVTVWNFAVPEPAALHSLLAPTLTLAFVGMVQNISMAQALAIPRNERVDANRELMALGSANIVASWWGGMPVGGGISRSAVNVAAGARSPLAGIVAALTLAALLLFTSHWFDRMPLPALAASIIAAAIAMVDSDSLRRAWAYDRSDAAAWLGTAVGVIVLGLQLGIALGIGLSLASLLWRSSQPHIAVVGRIPGTEHFRNVERHGTETRECMLMLRIDESLFFGNMAAVEQRLNDEISSHPAMHDVVLIMSAVNRIDTTALDILQEIQRTLAARGVSMHLAEVKGPVQDRLVATPLWKALQGRVHLSANAAFEAVGGRS